MMRVADKAIDHHLPHTCLQSTFCFLFVCLSSTAHHLKVGRLEAAGTTFTVVCLSPQLPPSATSLVLLSICWHEQFSYFLHMCTCLRVCYGCWIQLRERIWVKNRKLSLGCWKKLSLSRTYHVLLQTSHILSWNFNLKGLKSSTVATMETLSKRQSFSSEN